MNNQIDYYAFAKEIYNEREEMKLYVERYCKKEKKTPEEALHDRLVYETAMYYKDAIKGKVTQDGIVVGCGGADAPSGETK